MPRKRLKGITAPTDGHWQYEYRGPWHQHIITHLPGMTHGVLIADMGTQREVDANGYLMAASKDLLAALRAARKVILDDVACMESTGRAVIDKIDAAIARTKGPKQAWDVEYKPRPEQQPVKAETPRISLEELLAGLNPLEAWIVEKRGRSLRVWHYRDMEGLTSTGHKILWRADLEEVEMSGGTESFSDVAYRSRRRTLTYSANGETLPEAIMAALKAAQKGERH